MSVRLDFWYHDTMYTQGSNGSNCCTIVLISKTQMQVLRRYDIRTFEHSVSS